MSTQLKDTMPDFDAYPDARGRFGRFGGRYVPETLVPALDRLQVGVKRYLADPQFQAELVPLLAGGELI